MERYSVVFSSSTGNTKLLADAIDEALPKENRDYFGEITPEVPESEMLYVGFWTDRGNADKTALEFCKGLKTKRFSSSGRRASAAARTISKNTRQRRERP